jgi:hypothetical protein
VNVVPGDGNARAGGVRFGICAWRQAQPFHERCSLGTRESVRSTIADARLTGSAPLPPHHQLAKADVAAVTLKPDPEDAKVDRMIKNICRGC